MNESAVQFNPLQLANDIKAWARSLGFDLFGITSAQPSEYRDYFRQWLDTGRHGSMEYLAKRIDERVDPSTYLPGAKSVICVAMNYHTPLQEPTPSQTGKVARYALGEDYHEIIKPRLHRLADAIRKIAPNAQTKCAVDTAPVMEKELAARAGVGWIGKNTCVINSEIGSWLFLGEIITTLDLPHDEPAIDRCGSCRRCIDACPTGAITEPYQLDARKCISYLTIEHRGEIDPSLKPQMENWLFGCDICQDVCPWNSKAPWTNALSVHPDFASGFIDTNGILRWQPEDYSANLRHSAMRRVKLPVLQRNAQIVVDNVTRQSST
jgi:epoxyqueuosine reductase